MTSFESKVARIEAMFAAMGVRLGLVLIDYFQLVDVRGEGTKLEPGTTGFNIAARRPKNSASRFKTRPKALPVIDGRVVTPDTSKPSRVAFRRAHYNQQRWQRARMQSRRNARS